MPKTGQHLSVADSWQHSTFARNARYVDGISAKSISLILQEWSLSGRSSATLMKELDRLIATEHVSDNFLGSDFGRMLQEQGAFLLYHRPDLALRNQLERASSILQKSVYFNPDLADAWENLSLLSMTRGDCTAATRFGERAIEASSGNTERLQSLVGRMRELSRTPDVCNEKGAALHLYPDHKNLLEFNLP